MIDWSKEKWWAEGNSVMAGEAAHEVGEVARAYDEQVVKAIASLPALMDEISRLREALEHIVDVDTSSCIYLRDIARAALNRCTYAPPVKGSQGR